jgi:LysR family transcriptional regulator, glycine cleavage system transcriptional activator
VANASRLPSLNALRAFEAVARHQSIRKAAEELHVTSAAVRQQVKALEEEFGTRLLQRSDGRVVLTEAAQAGLIELRTGFESLAEGVKRMRSRGDRELLKVSVDPSLAATWLVSRLQRFAEQYPDIDVLIEATAGHADFARDSVDVAIRYGDGNFPGLHAVPIFDEQVCPVCSPRLRRAIHPLREPADLRWHTLLHLEWTPQKGRWPDWQTWLQAAGVTGVDFSKGPRFTQHSMALQAAVQGQGVALGSTALVSDDLAAGRLVCPFDFCLRTPFSYYVVAPSRLAQQRRIAVFRDWLAGEADRAAR